MKRVSNLQLGTTLGLLQDGLHLSRLHDVALNLQLATHEETLGVGLSGDQLSEVLVRQVESDYETRELLVFWQSLH